MTTGVATSARVRSARLVVAGLAAGVVADVVFDPDRRHVPLCPMHSLTGLWCPLCGGLRATYSIAHGRLTTAMHDNLLLVCAAPLLTLWLADQLHRARSGRPARTVGRPTMIVLVVLALAFTVLRNLPAIAFLAPR